MIHTIGYTFVLIVGFLLLIFWDIIAEHVLGTIFTTIFLAVKDRFWRKVCPEFASESR